MQVTMIAAGLLGLLLLALSIRVTMIRRSGGVSMGDGGRPDLLARVRAQANCAEYVPAGLILIFLAEQGFGATWFVIALAAAFVAGRFFHPVGMAMPAPNAPRILGTVLTWTPLGLLAILVLAKGLTL
jgi:hypothetical protein